MSIFQERLKLTKDNDEYWQQDFLTILAQLKIINYYKLVYQKFNYSIAHYYSFLTRRQYESKSFKHFYIFFIVPD